MRGKALAVGAFGSEHAANAVEQLLQPLAQLMVGHSLQLGTITEMLKKALVNAALTNYGTVPQTLTDSRIAILTGVHRKDVSRLRETPQALATEDTYVPLMSVSAQVVARWISDPAFLTGHNKARVLARTPRYAQPGEPDFSMLVAQVSNDVGARSVLDELMRLGITKSSSETHVELQDNAFVPKDGLSETFHFLASNVSDHLASAVHNLHPERTGQPMLEQSAFSHNLSMEDAAELEQLARLLWANALQQFLQKATAAEQRSSRKSEATQRVRYGVYFHQADMPAADTASAKRATTRKKAKT